MSDPITAALAASLPADIAEAAVKAYFSGMAINLEVVSRDELRELLEVAATMALDEVGKLSPLPENPKPRTQAGERIFAEQAAAEGVQGMRIVESLLVGAGPYAWVFGAGSSGIQVNVQAARFLLKGLSIFVREAEGGLLKS